MHSIAYCAQSWVVKCSTFAISEKHSEGVVESLTSPLLTNTKTKQL